MSGSLPSAFSAGDILTAVEMNQIRAAIVYAQTTADSAQTNSGVTTFNSRTGVITLSSADVTTALTFTPATTTALALKANLVSPIFTGNPSLPTGTIGITQTAGNNSTAVATTAFVSSAVTAGITYNPNAVVITGGSVNGTIIGGSSASSAVFTSLSSSTATLTSTAVSNSTTTGAVIINGGAGIAGAVNIGGPLVLSRSLSVTAAGTTQGTATVITSDIVVATTVASGTGLQLRDFDAKIFNRGANDLKIYPTSGAQIESFGANIAVTVAAGGFAQFVRASSTLFYVG